MSVINRVLKDLDRQGGLDASVLPGVRGVDLAEPARAPRWLGLGIVLAVGLGAAAWWFWPQSAPSVAALAPETPPPQAPAEPRLRLSQELSSLPDPRHPGTSRGPEKTPPASALRPHDSRGADATKALSVAPALLSAPRLDTRLPEPSAPAKPLVIKEMKPLTPAQQAEAIWRQAGALIEQGRAQEAQSLLEQALQLDPAHLRARQSLAVQALEGGRRAAAEALLREGASLHPGTPWFARSLAQLLIQQGDYAQAASVLKTALGKSAEAADWALYASLQAKLGRGEESATGYREALRRDPAQGTWWIGLGVALEQGAHADEAREAFSRALQTRLSPELKEFAARKAQGL